MTSPYIDEEAEAAMSAVIGFVRAIRHQRAEHRVPSSRWIECYIIAGAATSAARSLRASIESLARVAPLFIVETTAEYEWLRRLRWLIAAETEALDVALAMMRGG